MGRRDPAGRELEPLVEAFDRAVREVEEDAELTHAGHEFPAHRREAARPAPGPRVAAAVARETPGGPDRAHAEVEPALQLVRVADRLRALDRDDHAGHRI